MGLHAGGGATVMWAWRNQLAQVTIGIISRGRGGAVSADSEAASGGSMSAPLISVLICRCVEVLIYICVTMYVTMYTGTQTCML